MKQDRDAGVAVIAAALAGVVAYSLLAGIARETPEGAAAFAAIIIAVLVAALTMAGGRLRHS